MLAHFTQENTVRLPSASPCFDYVAQLRYGSPMKTATIPSVRVERRRIQAEFIARGLRSRDDARRTGDYVDADEVVAGLQRKLDIACARLSKSPKTGGWPSRSD
jgi:hypothetical protein